MDATNYKTFTVQMPIGIHIVTPMATNSTLLDQFSLLVATALGTLQQEPQRKEIERAMATEPLSVVQPYEFDLALRQMAYETAQKIAADFVKDLKSKLQPELPPLPSPPAKLEETAEPEPAPEQTVPAVETLPEPEIISEREPESEPESESEPVQEPPKPESAPPAAYQVGQAITNPLLAKVVVDISKCANGFEFSKVQGGFRCRRGMGDHFVTDQEAQEEYRQRHGV
jgi:hypothetical protein